MEFRTRLAALEDLESLSRLWEAMVEETRRQSPGLEIAPDSGGYFLQFAGVGLVAGSCGVFLAEQGDRILGFVMGQVVKAEPPFRPESYGYIIALYVAPEYRVKGLGRALMGSMSQWFAGKSLQRMELHVYAQNRDALRFWEAIGFSPLGFRLGSTVNSLLKTGPDQKNGIGEAF